jgi:hypothetical protein
MIPKVPQPHPLRSRSAIRQLVSALALSGLFVVASCSDAEDSPSEPTTQAGITGRITSNFPTGVARGVIRVEFDPSNANEGPKALVTVTPATAIFKLSRDQGEFRDLSNGIWVRVWFDGAVMESYPVQGTAGTIVIDSLGSSVMNRTP